MKNFLYLSALFISFYCYSQDDGRLIKIPVIFHIIYCDQEPDNGIDTTSIKNGNSTTNVPQAKLDTELTDLNKDFQNLNGDLGQVNTEYQNVIGNPKIQFFLQEVKYVKVSKFRLKWRINNSRFLHKISPLVTPQECLNVYVSVIKLFFKSPSGLSPVKTAAGSKYDDVVNISYKWTGLGTRLLTHEVGHWLGLWHTWDDSQAVDGITDIPLQNDFTDVNCAQCPLAVPDQLRSGTVFMHSNYNNFMDYSGCRFMFSKMQAQKMRDVIIAFRPLIWASSPPATPAQ